MRWDALFEDMEAQLAARQRLELEAEIAERALVDSAGVQLADRLRGSLGLSIRVHLSLGRVFEGVLSHAGSEALVLDEPQHQVLIPYAAAAHYGVIEMVGRDFLDLAVTREGEERPPVNARQVVAIPFGALAGIRSVGAAGG